MAKETKTYIFDKNDAELKKTDPESGLNPWRKLAEKQLGQDLPEGDDVELLFPKEASRTVAGKTSQQSLADLLK